MDLTILDPVPRGTKIVLQFLAWAGCGAGDDLSLVKSSHCFCGRKTSWLACTGLSWVNAMARSLKCSLCGIRMSRIDWRQYTTAKRAYILFSHILRKLETAAPSPLISEVRGFTVQSMKAMEQHALDGGQWDTAWGYTGLVDPDKPHQWAGTALDLTIQKVKQ